ncbi:MAG: hypothetical protein AAF602_28665 [Myxococcota bacterium]
MIASLTLLMSVSYGFAPDGPVGPTPDGPLPLVTDEPQRMLSVHGPVQRSLARNGLWQEFIAGEGQGWHAVFDEHSGVPHTMWGGGIAMPTERDALVQKVQRFLQRNAAVLGLRDGR